MSGELPSIGGSVFRGLIGAAQEDITPPPGIFARCWGAAEHDTAEGVHRPLMLTCVTLESHAGGPPLVLMSADLMTWRSREDEWFIRGAILEALNLDESRLMLNLAHTHAAPSTYRAAADRPGGHLIAPYLDDLRHKAVRVARRAIESRTAATLDLRYARCDLATNRDLPDPHNPTRYICGHNPAAAADDTLLVGRVTSDAGRIIATVVNYACHPTTLAWQNRLISPDYVGAMREMVGGHTKAPCLFLQGASGELAPAEQYTGDTAVADRHGRRVAYAVLSTLEAMPRPGMMLQFDGVIESGAPLAIWREKTGHISTDLAALMTNVEYALKPLPSLDELQAQWRNTTDPVMKERLWRKVGVRRIVGDGDTTAMPLWAWRIGEAFFIGQCNEAYSPLQTQLRARFGGRLIAVMNLVNGTAGYLPPRPLYDRDIYQVWQSPFNSGSLERLLQAAGQSLEQLSPKTENHT